MLTAWITQAPTAQAPRAVRVRFNGGQRDAPATLAREVTTALAAGDQVRVEMVGRKAVVVRAL